MLIGKKGKKSRWDLNILSFTWIVRFLTTSTHSVKKKTKTNTHTHTHTKKKKKKSVQHVFKMLKYSLNSLFYGSMESCRLACRLLICLHFILLCFSTLPLNFRVGMRSLIAALPCDLFVVMKQSPITYFYL